ncbi:MAG: hypothetical protein ABI405_01265 [Parafilimonas sp.]
MKYVSVTILFICLVAASFSNLCIIFSFNINQKFIAKELCVNKNDPAMQCNGHCYLSKQLANEEKPSSPFNTKSSERFEIQLFCVQLPPSSIYKTSTLQVYYTQKQNFTVQPFTGNNFHPPQV